MTPSRLPPRGRTPRKVLSPAKTPNDQGEEGIQVAIRMRPLNSNESARQRVWKVLPKYSSIAQTTPDGKPLPERVTGRTFFTFDKAFSESSTTQQVYDDVAKNIVNSVVTGLNGTIFAYGQTSSGKTFTMQGSGTIQEGSNGSGGGGVVHMAAQDIFNRIENSPDRIFLVRASFLEIYNEEVRDLLADDPHTRTLAVREDPRRGVFVQSNEEIVTDFESLLSILFRGEKSRAFASTAMNERSSRSHTIFRITIESRLKSSGDSAGDKENDDADGGDGAVLISTLNLVDLAGSESVRHTGATGDRQKEGGMINQSLLTLSRVIVALGTPNQTHINFRDSKLTRILQPSLSGNARMAVICCATPSELYLEETRSTLQFASRAKLVKTNAQVNEVLDDRSVIRRLQKELAEARRTGGSAAPEHLKELEQKAETAGSAARQAEERLKRLQSSILNSGVLFNNDDESTIQTFSKTSKYRKRRFSDGNLLFRSPAKHMANLESPKTMPRPMKKGKAEVARPLSPDSQLILLRDALTIKNSFAKSLKQKVDEMVSAVEGKESELAAMNFSNDILRSERDSSKSEVIDMSATLNFFRAELAETVAAHEAALKERDGDIQKALVKLKQELQDRKDLEAAVDSLQDEKLLLLQQHEAEIQEQREMANLVTDENATLKSLLETASLERDDLRTQLEITKVAKENAEAEKFDLLGTVENLQTEHEKTLSLVSDITADRDRQISKRDATVATLEEKNADFSRLSNLSDQYLKTIAELEQEKEQLHVEVSSVRDDVKAKDELCRESAHQINEIESANAKLQAQCRNLLDELTLLSDAQTHLSAKNQGLMEEIAESRNTVKERSVSIALLTEKVSSLEKQLVDRQDIVHQHELSGAKAEEKLVELEAVVETKTSAMNDALQDMQRTKALLEDANSRASDLQEKLESSLLKGKEQDTTILDLKSQLEINNQKAVDLQDCLARSSNEIQAARNELNSVDSALSVKVEEVSLLIKERDEAQSELTSAKDRWRQEQGSVHALEGKVAFFQSSSEKSNDLCKKLRHERDDALKRSDQLELSVQELSGKIEELDKDTERHLDEISLISSAREAAVDKARKLAQRLKRVESQVLPLSIVVSHLFSKDEAAYTTLSDLTKDRDSSVCESERLARQLAHSKGDLVSAQTHRKTAEDRCVKFEQRVGNLTIRLTEKTTQLDHVHMKLDALVVLLSYFESNARMALDSVSIAEDERDVVVIASKSELGKHQLLSREQATCISTLRDELDRVNDRYSTAEKEIVSLIATINERETKIEDLSAKVASIESLSRDATLVASTLQAEKDEVVTRLSALECQYKVVVMELETLKQDKGNTDTRCSELEAQALSLRNEIAGKSERMQQLNTEIAQVSHKAGQYQAKLEESEMKLDAFELQKAMLQSIPSKQLVVLFSSQSFQREVKANQDKAFTILNASKIRHVTVDGADPSNKEKRSQLFDVSGLGPHYPQFFISDGTNTTFWGDWERLMQANDDGSLEGELLSCLTIPPPDQSKEELAEITIENTKLRTELLEALDERKAHADELIQTHDMLESTNTLLIEARQRINNLEDELDSKESMLLQSLKAYEEEKVELEQKLSSCVQCVQNLEEEVVRLNEKLSIRFEMNTNPSVTMSDRVAKLEEENRDLKELLASTNTAVDEARESSLLSDIELNNCRKRIQELVRELSEQEEKQKQVSLSILDSQSIGEEHKELLVLRQTLQNERSAHVQFQAEQKELRGEEQRALIQEAEATMHQLRRDCGELRLALKKSEAEAYAAREANEELRDQHKLRLEEVIQVESKLAAFENENARLKRSARRRDAEVDFQVDILTRELKKMRTELLERNERASKAKELETKNASLFQELDALTYRVSDLDGKNRELENEIAVLGVKLTEALNKKPIANAEVDTLHKLVTELQIELQSKDERIKKLSAVKLTKEQVTALKKMKVRQSYVW
jgi:centromeric protein E